MSATGVIVHWTDAEGLVCRYYMSDLQGANHSAFYPGSLVVGSWIRMRFSAGAEIQVLSDRVQVPPVTTSSFH